jgi:hypothetical protein
MRLFLLLFVFLMACDTDAEDLRDIMHNSIYLQDSRTGLCFNYYHSGALVLLTEVPCTDKVLSRVQEEKQ